jgi:hypothetical protein
MISRSRLIIRLLPGNNNEGYRYQLGLLFEKVLEISKVLQIFQIFGGTSA